MNVSDSMVSFILSIEGLLKQLDSEPDVTISTLRSGYQGIGEVSVRKLRPKAIIFVNSKSKADEIKNRLDEMAASHKKKLKFFMDMVGSDDVLLSERDAKSSVFSCGSSIKSEAIRIIQSDNELSLEDCDEIRKIEALNLKEEPIYTITKNTGKNYSYTYFSHTENRRIQRSVGDIVILYSPTMANGCPAYTRLNFHETTRKLRTDLFIPSADNCVYYSNKLYIRERIVRGQAKAAGKSDIAAAQVSTVPTIRLPVCPACGGKVTFRTGKNGVLKLECVNYFEKGKTCPNDYDINDYVKVIYE